MHFVSVYDAVKKDWWGDEKKNADGPQFEQIYWCYASVSVEYSIRSIHTWCSARSLSGSVSVFHRPVWTASAVRVGSSHWAFKCEMVSERWILTLDERLNKKTLIWWKRSVLQQTDVFDAHPDGRNDRAQLLPEFHKRR